MTTDDAILDLARQRLKQMETAEDQIALLNAYHGLLTLAELAMPINSPLTADCRRELQGLEHKATKLFANTFK
ncbi:hypothetical protein [Celeribacter ethanolicus]|uniref:hypothetical protein n=1 Tax=Celeribacter ethanolicus TaxID=1758178 RepID=UPI00082A98CE|nr:hypothetical protein [Celeribacter ethanolicus]TNE63190.1 MAG: hypothetical protein EP336_17990 [Paracoccaceae bacterium]